MGKLEETKVSINESYNASEETDSIVAPDSKKQKVKILNDNVQNLSNSKNTPFKIEPNKELVEKASIQKKISQKKQKLEEEEPRIKKEKVIIKKTYKKKSNKNKKTIEDIIEKKQKKDTID